MSNPKDTDRTSSDEDLPTQSEKRSGRATFDERGNAVWEWQLETGVYSKDVSTQKLRKLELDDLSIAETAVTKRPAVLSGGEKTAGSGINPYENSPRVGGGTSPYDTARVLGDKWRNEPQPQKRRTLDDMRRLSEAIKKEKKDR
jgi:hypothetical protein